MPNNPSENGPRWPRVVAISAALLAFAIVWVRCAWVCDDAYITFRTIDNFVNGYGPRFNVAERVQAYTHPLWMLVVSAGYVLTREPYYTSLAISLVCTLVALGVLAWRVARPTWVAVGVVAILAVSKAFVDFSSSGLENPLTHLLLVLFAVAYWRFLERQRGLLLAGLLAGLLTLNRFDAALLVLPALLVAGWKSPRRMMVLAAGFAPLAAWLAFSAVYYGTPFPNTAYAKLGADVGRGFLQSHGLTYLVDALRYDPVTPLVTLAALVVGFVWPSRRATPLCAGVALYVAYVVWVGGDFMSGRFLASPFLLSVAVLAAAAGRRVADAAIRSRGRVFGVVGGVLAVVIGLVSPTCPLWSGIDYAPPDTTERIATTGVSDERGFYYKHLGLLRALFRGEGPAAHEWAQSGGRAQQFPVVQTPTIGLVGMYAGPTVYVIDENALSDPLLARLPARRDVELRVGHMRRAIPAGYADSLRADANMIADPRIARLYDDVRLVTRGPLWSRARFAAIWRLNFGSAESLP